MLTERTLAAGANREGVSAANGEALPTAGELAGGVVTLADLLTELRRIRQALESQAAELLDADRAAAMCGVSVATWYRLVSSGKVPRPVALSLNGRSLKRWRKAELLDFIARL